MYPGPDDPDLGVFVAQLERALERARAPVRRAVIDTRAGGHARSVRLFRDARSARPQLPARRRLRPLPRPGRPRRRARVARAARGHRARPGRRQRRHPRRDRHRHPSCRPPRGRGRRRLRLAPPRARGEGRRMRAARSRSSTAASTSSCSNPLPRPRVQPAYLCVGSLTERKNVLRLANAFERLGEGTLTFVGDGPLRPQLEGRPGIELAGHVPHDEHPRAPRRCPRRLRPEPRGAVRPGPARSPGRRAARRRDQRRRPPGVRPARGGRAGRSARRGRDPRRAPPRRRAPVPERGGASRPPASTTSAGRPSGSRRSWRGPRARPSPGGEARRRRCRRATRDRVRGGRGRCASPRCRYGCPCGP